MKNLIALCGLLIALSGCANVVAGILETVIENGQIGRDEGIPQPTVWR